MHGKKIVFFDPERKSCRVASRALNATGSEVSVYSDMDEFLAALQAGDRVDLIMASYDAAIRAETRMLECFDEVHEKHPSSIFVLHTTEDTEDYMPVMQDRNYLRNLIAKNENPLDPEELIVTAEKLLRGDLFGIQKYMLWGVEPLTIAIRESHDKPKYIDKVARYAEDLGCNSRTVELIESIVDELVTNAIFNAPVDEDGKPKYRHLHRSESVSLSVDEAATLQFACDGNFIAVATRDPFGSLESDTVVQYLNRCLIKGPRQLSEDSGGAGIGLFRVFNSVSKFVINLDPGNQTEVMCLIDLRMNMRQFRLASKSFHFFVR